MKNKPEYLEFVVEWLSPLGEITTRAMFGGHVVYCHGLTFALIADNVLHLKVDDETRPRFEAAGLKAFQPFPDRPDVMQYYTAPPEFFEDPGAMRSWAGAAVETARRAQAKRAPRKRALKKGRR
jgi:DNA transformation protein and related proteins